MNRLKGRGSPATRALLAGCLVLTACGPALGDTPGGGREGEPADVYEPPPPGPPPEYEYEAEQDFVRESCPDLAEDEAGIEDSDVEVCFDRAAEQEAEEQFQEWESEYQEDPYSGYDPPDQGYFP